MKRIDIITRLVAGHAAGGVNRDLMHNVTTYTIVQAAAIADMIIKEDKAHQQQMVREKLG